MEKANLKLLKSWCRNPAHTILCREIKDTIINNAYAMGQEVNAESILIQKGMMRGATDILKFIENIDNMTATDEEDE